ncbi:MAG: phosphatase PAP2 family protein [bacterium]|nr:phosphatase PAP2 family protein [bacterium]
MTEQAARSPIARTAYAFDWIVLGYCLLMLSAILAFGRPLADYTDELVFYAAMAAVALLIMRFVDSSGGRWQALVRLLYPGAMFTFFYRATGGLMFLLTDQFLDWQVVTFENMLLGANPTLYIDSHLLNVWTNEILSFCYFSYYPMLPVFLIAAFAKKHYRVIREFSAAACLTFFISYLLFSLYPVEGPRWHFAELYTNSVEGPIFRPLVEMVIDRGAVRGGAMPSSHTGIALVIMLFCFRYYRKAGWVLLPIVTGLAIGTVWGRFHYASDVFAGAAIGIFSLILVWKYQKSPTRDVSPHKEQKELSRQDVS